MQDIDSSDYDKNSTLFGRDERTGKIRLEELPNEYPLQHVSVKWVESTEAAFGLLLAVAQGGWPHEARLIRDRSLEDIPALPDTHPDHHRRLEARLRLQYENDCNQQKRVQMCMRARTSIYQMLHKACEKNAPTLARQLHDSCDLSALGDDFVGMWDGCKAWRIVLERLNFDPSKAEKNFYRDCEKIVRETQLPAGSQPEAFEKKALKYVTDINDNLSQPLKGGDLGDFLLDLLPISLEDAAAQSGTRG